MYSRIEQTLDNVYTSIDNLKKVAPKSRVKYYENLLLIHNTIARSSSIGKLSPKSADALNHQVNMLMNKYLEHFDMRGNITDGEEGELTSDNILDTIRPDLESEFDKLKMRVQDVRDKLNTRCQDESTSDKDKLDLSKVDNQNTTEYKSLTNNVTENKQEVTQTTNQHKKENNTMETKNTSLDISAIMKMKMADKMMNGKDDGELNLAKMAMVQSFTEKGTIEVNEVIKAKFTEKIMKKLDASDEIPMEDLIVYQSIQETGKIDPNTLFMAKWMGKLMADTVEEPSSKEDAPKK